MAKKKYTIAELLEVSKCQDGIMKHYIMEYYYKGLIVLYHTWKDKDTWFKTTQDALDNVLEYPDIYTIRIEVNRNCK